MNRVSGVWLVERYNEPRNRPEIGEGENIMVLDVDDHELLVSTGAYLEGENRDGAFVVCDHDQAYLRTRSPGYELLSIAVALDRYSWLREQYYFHAVPKNLDKTVARCAEESCPLGFFLHVEKGVKITLPIQAVMYMKSDSIEQMIHNVVILEEGSQAQLITGCLAGHQNRVGTHIAIEELYIGKGAKLVSTMVHTWGADQQVYPFTGAIVEEDGRFESNYVSLRSAKHLVSNPHTWLVGRRASAKYLTVVLASPGSTIETGGVVHMDAEETSAELAHRGVCTGGIMKQGGLLVGNSSCKAHVDCAGMLLDRGKDGYIESVPGLCSKHPEARMSHEASIGKIAPEEVAYLLSKGMEEREAISMLIRGFLGTDIDGLGADLDEQISSIVEVAGHGEG
jgi:Fe-S cluster assembly scaffold protein SufB